MSRLKTPQFRLGNLNSGVGIFLLLGQFMLPYFAYASLSYNNHFPTSLFSTNIKTTQLSPSLPYQFAFIATQGTGKHKISAIVTTLSDGSQPTIRYQVQGNITSLHSGYDGKTLTFTQQQYGYPQIYALSLSANTLTLLTPYRANNIGGSLSADNKKLLFSSDLTNGTDSNVDIYLKDTQTQQITRLTNDPMIDITPMWTADGQGFIFSSDRSEANHPQIYRYEFASYRTQALTMGGYHVNGNLSQDGRFLTLLSSPQQGSVMDIGSGKIYPINNVGLEEAPSVSNDGRWLVYATGTTLAVVTTQNLPDTQPRLIEIPLNKIQQALQSFAQKTITNANAKDKEAMSLQNSVRIRQPVWVSP